MVCALGLFLAPILAGPARAALDLPVRPDVLSQEMKDWLARKIPRHANELTQLSRLLEALQRDQDGPRLRYREGYTGTAQEAFETGEGNCLSFSQVVVAMARELGVRAFYMDVRQFEEFTKEGDLVIVAGHMTAGFDEGIERRILEFSVGPDVEYRNAVRISDETARAYYHSNRGAEHLQAGEIELALEWLEAATQVDPNLPDAWANYGVALRRNGQLREAEAAYRRAVELDPNFFPGYQNLVALYRMRGDGDAAKLLLEVLGRQTTRNPFVYLAVGDLSMDQGDWEGARQFYRQGRRLRRSDPDLLAALGEANLRLGDLEKAEKLLNKALKKDPENERAKRLQGALERTSGG
ncbi:MAG: tetratricopeptide repeat protein [bacterium]|nr:tetratricopeptide repeat protein [bacterium]